VTLIYTVFTQQPSGNIVLA